MSAAQRFDAAVRVGRRVLPAARVLLLAGCRAGPPPKWTDVPVVECGHERSGSEAGKIEGNAFVLDEEGRRIQGSMSLMNLDPETEESILWFSRTVYPDQDKKGFKDVSAAISKRRVQVRATKDGHFEFESVSPGRYFVTADVAWCVPTSLFRWTWDLDFMIVTALAYARVDVRGGGDLCAISVTRPGEMFQQPRFR